jgi:hypothetical protein
MNRSNELSAQEAAFTFQQQIIQQMQQQQQQHQQQMMQQQGQGGTPGGQGNPNGPMRQGNNNGNSDPLGRESHDKGDNSRSLYDPMGTPAAQRAQKILEELRRRLSDPSRPQEEIDYLERLLKRY